MSVMTRGIIAQPYSLAMHSDYSRRQFYSHAQALLAEHDSARKHWENESNNVQALMDEVARLKVENAGLKTGYQAYEQVNAELKAENEALRANSSLSVLLPELDSALEDLELHGQHSDQGYRKLKDWYRKVDLACKAIDAAMSKAVQP